MTHGCYSIKQFDYPDLGLKIDCMEDWSAYAGKDGENNSKPKKLESVMCWDKRFFFSPNGLFHSAMLHGDVDKYSDYKDSLALIAGKCSTL